jgi:hypothetical protein
MHSHTGHLPKEEAAKGHDVTYGAQELHRKDVSCPETYTTKLRRGPRWRWWYGGLARDAITLDCVLARCRIRYSDRFG